MDSDVIVVGAGPTGLTLAHELTLGGASVLLLDKAAARSGESRALNLLPRTAEELDLRGLLSLADERAQVRLPSTHFAKLPVPLTFDTWDTRYPYQLGIRQAEVEQILENRVLESGVKVLWNHEVAAVEQDENHVRAKVGDTWYTASYLVACDGGRSTVRKILDVPFPGLDARWWASIADIAFNSTSNDIPKQWDTKGTHRGRPDGTFARLFPIGPDDIYRIFYSLGSKPIDNPRAPVSDEEVIGVVHDLFGEENEVRFVRWATRFSDASRQVEQYRIGRVLLAGDAAHTHLPIGGQGMSLGIQDAMNLGWKLAAVTGGWAPDGLLDTYHDERHPIGAGVIANTRAQAALGQPGDEQEALRAVFTDLMKLPEVNRQLSGWISGLGIRYELGQNEPVGGRLVDFRLADGEWASSLFHHGRGVLLSTRHDILAEAAAWAQRVTPVRVNSLPYEDTAAVLVRPDGYICWAPGSPVSIALQRWFGAPSGSPTSELVI